MTSTITETQISDAIGNAAREATKQGKDAVARVEIKVNAPVDAKTIETVISKAAFSLAANGKIEGLTVSTPVASVTLDREALSAASGEAEGDVKITASRVGISAFSDEVRQMIGDRPVVDIEIISGGKKITEFGGGDIQITLPYTLKEGEDKNAVIVYYIDSNEELRTITNGKYEEGFVTFKTGHLSKFAVGYNKIEFADVAGWTQEYITFLAARGIVNGVSAGMFEPDRHVTRAEFVKMLAMLSGETTPQDALADFDDVGPGEWYAPYVAWAAKGGYVLGTSEKTFAPNAQITREQIATILVRFSGAKNDFPGQAEVPSTFADEADISAYAKEAVMLMKGAGIITGRPGNVFAPCDSATRAESAKMLAEFLSLMIRR